ncbi:MAG: FAD-binding protein [Chloroflexi bacterium]|nr:FAD-binding protein [Chloroflexota bacterium]
MAQEIFDVIIIGGGSAGCAAAARLTEDPACKVLLIEAGPDPQPLPDIVAAGRRDVNLLLESDYILMYPSERKVDGSTFYELSGRIMGGGSSVNAMAAPRPTRLDFENWVAHGNPSWSYEECLPILRRMESDQDFPDSPIHGSSGPIYIKRPWTFDQPLDEPVQAFIERVTAMGLPICPDLNGPDPFGVGPSASNIKNGARQSTTVAYLDPARGRPNLTIVADALVTGLKISGKHVDAVQYVREGQSHSATADRVVLSAGALHSPQILMLSGIGPEAELNRLGIPVVNNLAGVGENHQDHAKITMTFEGQTGYQTDWIIPRARLVYKSDPSLSCGNFHIGAGAPIQVGSLKPMLPVGANLVQQTNRGRVTLQNRDPAELPNVHSPMLEDPVDIAAMRNAMEFIMEMTHSGGMEQFYGPLIQPAPSDDWITFAQSTMDSYHHSSGTCMMAPASNPRAVVDERLRVHGMDNLWVADASIFPTIPHVNTNLTAIMVGERLSDFFKEGK